MRAHPKAPYAKYAATGHNGCHALFHYGTIGISFFNRGEEVRDEPDIS